MSDTARVQRWRQRLRDEGKAPVTIWLTTDEKLRLEDVAATSRCSPSEVVQHALAQYHLGTHTVTDTVSVTEQLHAMVQAELAGVEARLTASVTDTVTAIVTATVTEMLRGQMVRMPERDVVADTVTEIVADTVAVTVTETVTETVAETGYDTAKYVLGTLCKRGHAHPGTGGSLRRKKDKHCVVCDQERIQGKSYASAPAAR